MSTSPLARARSIELAPSPQEASRPAPWKILPIVLTAMFMAQFDLYVVNVALPLFQHDLRAGPSALELIVGGYAFMYAAGLITGGRLGDLLGHRHVFIVGMLAFGCASLLCGIASSPGELVGARLLQGLTAALMVPQVLALITASFDQGHRSRALAWFGVTIGVGAVAGQVLGGVLLNEDILGLGWRVIFFVNVPVALLAALLATVILDKAPLRVRPKLDPLGALGISSSLALVLVPLTLGRSEHWPAWTWGCLALSLPTLGVTWMWERSLERRTRQPLLDPGLFKTRAFNLGLIVGTAIFASFFSFVFALTLTLQDGLGLDPLRAGLTFAPLGVAFSVASITARTVVARYGTRLVTLGIAVAAAGFALLVFMLGTRGATTSIPDLVGPMILVGIGNGLAVPALIGAVLAHIRPQQAGAAAGVLTTSQQFASAVGIAGLGAIFFETLGGDPTRGSYISALEWTTSCSFILALGALTLSRSLRRD